MNTKPKITRTDAKNNPWWKFMVETLRIDKKYEEPLGWHWFCAFKDLSDVDLALVQEKFPNEHPFKSKTPIQSFLRPELDNAIIWLKSELKITGNIEEIDFSGVIFKYFGFSYLVFPIKVSFKNAVFLGDANFKNTLFFSNIYPFVEEDIDTSKTISISANFNKTQFTENADFTDTHFFDNVIFNEAVFDQAVSFNNATFDNFAMFCGVVFHHSTRFIDAKFCNLAAFSKTKFLNGVQFSKAIFMQDVSFNKIKIESSINFDKTIFKNRAPEFYNAELYSEIIWDRNFKLWPQIKKGKYDVVYKKKMRDNQNAYENLASLMKKLDKYHDEHFFYRQEMRCRRWLAGYPTKCFYWLYETFSDYGYGIERALLGWFLHIVLGAFLLFVHHFCNPIGKWYYDLGCSFGVSFSNAHGFLSFHDKALKKCSEHLEELYWFNTIWLFQTIFGILFLFLLVLTVRIRFRLK